MSRLILPSILGVKVSSVAFPENAILHYDMSQISYNDDDIVNFLPDLSGMGKNLTQDKTVPMPVFKTNILNGKPVLRYTGSQGLIYLFENPTEETLDVDFSVFLVGRVVGSTQTFISFTHNLSGSAPVLFRRTSTGMNAYTTRGNISTTFQPVISQFYIHSINKINGILQYRINNQIMETLAQNLGSLTGAPRGVSLGYWDNNNSPTQYLNGDIAFSIAYKQGFDDDTVNQINQILSNRYNIPLTL